MSAESRKMFNQQLAAAGSRRAAMERAAERRKPVRDPYNGDEHIRACASCPAGTGMRFVATSGPYEGVCRLCRTGASGNVFEPPMERIDASVKRIVFEKP